MASEAATLETRPDLRVRIGPLELKNPVTVASGTYGYGTEYAEFHDPGRLGAIFLKGLTLEPRGGNAPQRLVETPSGLMNAIGLQNVGLEEFIRYKLPAIEGLATLCIANICGSTMEEYVTLAERLSAIARVDAIELNISCPNVKSGCIAFGSDPRMTEEVTRRVVRATDRPVIVKLSPNVTSIAEMARAAEAGGAAGLAVVNTFLALAIDVKTRRPKLGNVTGGLSGPAIRPIAVRMVWDAYQAVRIPIIGQGGITCARDALEFFIAGASAISIGTQNFVDPLAPITVLEGIEQYLIENGMARLSELVGSLQIPEEAPAAIRTGGARE
ncbi:MAG TPA: dihydroorotate dehydrogenase [Candidatus Sumerlaeota bacterium]|nr:dihydroorotate dehydrogenase [Candidatus Sumerlaeota bacterium]HPK02043.1 dihydroorotate dehydrogenase [Candidatus Sumerlaeota bacterium]